MLWQGLRVVRSRCRDQTATRRSPGPNRPDAARSGTTRRRAAGPRVDSPAPPRDRPASPATLTGRAATRRSSGPNRPADGESARTGSPFRQQSVIAPIPAAGGPPTWLSDQSGDHMSWRLIGQRVLPHRLRSRRCKVVDCCGPYRSVPQRTRVRSESARLADIHSFGPGLLPEPRGAFEQTVLPSDSRAPPACEVCLPRAVV